MNLTDIIALAKQGYTPKDIKELIALGSDVSEEKPPEEVQTQEAEIDGSDEQKAVATQEADQVLDYKKLYEDEQQKVSDLTKQLEASQKKNTRENVDNADKINNQDIINDIARSFM